MHGAVHARRGVPAGRLLIPLLVVALAAFALPASAQEDDGPPSRPIPVGTMSELMVRVIYPASDAVFYIETRTPTDGAEWAELEGWTLMLAEAGNILMLPGHARDRDRWMGDARLLRDAGEAAFAAARERDVEALKALNDRLYRSCVQCHENYRPDYGRRPR